MKSVSLDVHLTIGDVATCITGLSPQEAFNLLMMPSFGSYIVSMVPNWTVSNGVSSVPEPENKE